MNISEPAKAPEAASVQDAKPAKTKKKKKGSFLKSCLVSFLVLALLVGVLAATVLGLWQKWGIVKSPAIRLLAQGTPYRAEAAAMKEELQANGFETKGVEIAVFPVTDSDKTVAVATLDASQGFTFSDASVTDAFVKMVGGETASEMNVVRAAILYKDPKGRELMAVTAPTDAIKGFADGSITKEEFYRKMDGKFDIPNLTTAIQEELDATSP